MKVIIVGAGIAGMAIGWRLAQAGADVGLYDRGLAGRGATWCSAGMIAPGAELKDETQEFAAFARRSRAVWPNFAAELEAASGCGIGYNESGSLIVALDDVHADMLAKRSEGVNALEAQWLDAQIVLQREPLVSPEVRGALYIPDDAQVDNRRIADALRIALERRNIVIQENTEVRGLHIADTRVRGIVCAKGIVASDAVIIASGAWLNDFGGAPAELPPVAPVKGQMVSVQAPAGTALPKHLLWSDDTYLVSRGGRVLIGATVEDAGFDTSVSADAYARLLASAMRIVPALRQWPVSEMWAGLRPRTPDGAPVLGASSVEGLFVAGGQFRNGILFAPAVANAMQQIVLTSRPAPELRSFDPRRFNAH